MSDEVLLRLIQQCSEHHGDLEGDVPDALRESTRLFLGEQQREPELLVRAAAMLEELPPAGAAWLALTFGSAVEHGADPRPSSAALLDCLEGWMEALPTVDSDSEEEDEELPQPTARQTELLEYFPFVCQALVAHLARLPSERERLAQDQELLSRLELLQAYSHGASWVREALLRTSGKLIVLHPPTGQGFELSYSHVANCFHLFSLVQTALGSALPGGRRADAGVTAACRGQVTKVVHDEAWWHYGDPYCPTPTLQGSVWGEASVRSLPVIDGARVLLLWPKLLLSRTWDGGFFGPHLAALPSDIEVARALTAEEASRWLGRLGVEGYAKPSPRT
jgi:hypothetical protein